MSWFQPVKRDSVMTTLDVDDKVFVSTLDHFAGSIVWLLQGSAGGVMAYKNMGACRQCWAHISGSLGWAGGSGVKLLHGRFQLGNVTGWVNGSA